MEVHIYIGTDSKAPRIQVRKYGYVLACTLKGKLETKQGFRETKGTYNRATLEAITEAVGRVVKPSEIHIHTENAFSYNARRKFRQMGTKWICNYKRRTCGKWRLVEATERKSWGTSTSV